MSEKILCEKVGAKMGWNFKDLTERTKIEGKKWIYTEKVRQFLDNEKVIMDVGTGGGEKLLELVPNIKKAIGVDNAQGMIKTAQENAQKSRLINVEFLLGDADHLPAENQSMDLVINRHGPINIKEIKRVLKKNGLFITQQVGCTDKSNIKQVFGRGQNFGFAEGHYYKLIVEKLKQAGFEIIEQNMYDAKEY